MEIDAIDRQLLALLQQDCRLSNKELASRVELAPSTCFERVRKLREAGILKGWHARVDPEALGIELEAIVSIRLARHSREAVQAFHDHVESLPEVLAIFHITGRQDFVLHVAVRDTDHLRDLTMDAFTTREEVAQIETALIYESSRKFVLPDLKAP